MSTPSFTPCATPGCPHPASGKMHRPGICVYHAYYEALDPLPKQWPENWPECIKPSVAKLTAWGRSDLIPAYWPSSITPAT